MPLCQLQVCVPHMVACTLNVRRKRRTGRAAECVSNLAWLRPHFIAPCFNGHLAKRHRKSITGWNCEIYLKWLCASECVGVGRDGCHYIMKRIECHLKKKKETFRLLTFNNFIPNGAFWKIMRNNLFASCCLFIYSLRLKMFPLLTHSYLWSILSPVNIISKICMFLDCGWKTEKLEKSLGNTRWTCTHCTPYEKQSRSKSSRFHLK